MSNNSASSPVCLSIDPLCDQEKGRGAIIPPDRVAEIEAECLRLMRVGVRQHEIGAMLGATRSRVARWCQSAAKKIGTYEDRARLHTKGKTDAQFIWSRLDIAGADDCWLWTGAVKPNGYGTVHTSNGTFPAHRAVYELLIGPAEGLQVDHICRNRRCCNPRHLQAVSANINLYLVKARANA